MRVPRPAAGMITITFMAGCKYTGGEEGVQINRGSPDESRPLGLDLLSLISYLLSFIYLSILSIMYLYRGYLYRGRPPAVLSSSNHPSKSFNAGASAPGSLQETLYQANSAGAKETLA